METAIKYILSDDEKVIWYGKPNTRAVIVNTALKLIYITVPAILIYLLFSALEVKFNILGYNISKQIILWVALLLDLLLVIYMYIFYATTRYAITTDRALIKTGLIGADIRSMPYNKIKSVDIKVDLIDKLTGTGRLYIDTGKIVSDGHGSKTDYDELVYLYDPYKVYKILQDAINNSEQE